MAPPPMSNRVKLKLVLENVYDKLKLQTTKNSSALPIAPTWQPGRLRVKMSNNSQRITVPTMQRQRVASPPSITLMKLIYKRGNQGAMETNGYHVQS